MKIIFLTLFFLTYCISTPEESITPEQTVEQNKPLTCPDKYEVKSYECVIKKEYILKPLPVKETKLVKIGKLYWQDGDSRYYPDWGEKCFNAEIGTNKAEGLVCSKEGIKHYIGFEYEEAEEYCKAKGMRLPTEKEWKELIKSKKENLLTFTATSSNGADEISEVKVENFFWLDKTGKPFNEAEYLVAGDKPNPYECNSINAKTIYSTFKIDIGELYTKQDISFREIYPRYLPNQPCHDKDRRQGSCSPYNSKFSVYGRLNGKMPMSCNYYFMVRCVTDKVK